MSPRAVAAVAVACLVVVAGCNVFVGGQPRPDRETVTPAPVPGADGPTPGATGTGPVTAPPTPPGVARNGTVNVTALENAHEAYLADRSYNWTFRYQVTRDDAPVFTRTRQIRAGTDAVLVRDHNLGRGVNYSIYVADGVGYRRLDHAPGPSRVSQPLDREAYVALAGETVRRFTTDVSFTVTVVERDGQTYYRLHAANDFPPGSLGLADRGTVRDYTATVYVTADGFVRTIVADYDHLPEGGDRPEDRVTVSFRSHYTGVGSTTVERPAWVTEVTPTPGGTPTAASRSTLAAAISSTPPATPAAAHTPVD